MPSVAFGPGDIARSGVPTILPESRATLPRPGKVRLADDLDGTRQLPRADFGPGIISGLLVTRALDAAATLRTRVVSESLLL
jgi:hypothetical protein